MFYIRHTLLTSEVRFNKTEINWSHKINAKYMYVLFKNIHKCLWRDIVCKLFLFLFKGWKMLLKLWKIFPTLQLPLVSITCKINKFYFTACRFNEILPVYRLIIIYHKGNYHLLHFIVNIAVFILQWKKVCGSFSYKEIILQWIAINPRKSSTSFCHSFLVPSW